MMPKGPAAWLVALVLLATVPEALAQATGNGCLDCHRGLPDSRLASPAGLFSAPDIHRERGFGCVDCHGGNAAADLKEGGHDATRGFTRRPAGQAVVAMCARCHSDADRMRRVSPRQRTDQAAEYATSAHGKRLAAGDLGVATCASCHGAHGVRGVRDPNSQGVASAVAACGTCHAAFAQKFETSVHRDIFEKGCVECHGSHAVLPPTPQMLGTGEGGLCGSCHSGNDDKGAQAAAHMRSAIDGLRARLDGSLATVAQVANAGMDVSVQELALAEARTQLTLARTEMHSSKAELVDSVIAAGLKLVDTADAADERALAELRFRRTGLAASLFAILLLVVALALKIRQIERRQAGR